jgi:hypothetical protein
MDKEQEPSDSESLPYSSTLKVEAICSSDTSVDFQQSAWHYITEDRAHHNHQHENLKAYTKTGLSFTVDTDWSDFQNINSF